MEITLKNGKKINLDINLVLFEYLEEYEGGLEQLQNDILDKNMHFFVFNFILYCLIQASSDEEYSYREAVSLVCIEDYDRITDFIYKNVFKKDKENLEVIEINNKEKITRKHRK